MSLNKAEKMEIIEVVEGSLFGAKRTLRELGISRSTFYSWYRRYLDHGIEGLSSHKRVPKVIWNRIPDTERAKVIETALAYPEKSCREIACLVIDREGYYVSESSAYRILKEKGLVQSPVFAVISAKDKWDQPTVRINQLWQTDFTYFKVEIWGWYYLLTIMDDFSRYILAWKLCTSMEAAEVKTVLGMAIDKTGMKDVPLIWRPGLLSDNGSAFVSASLKEYIEKHDMWQVHGKPYHPQTQGKIERYHRSMKNIILLDKYYQPGHLEYRIGEWVEYYNNGRYHEGIGNVTPADKYFGRSEEVIRTREKIKMATMRKRKAEYRRRLTCA
jgi:transposase InsO family protein